MNFFNLLVILHFCLSWVDRFSEAHNFACCISALRRWLRMNFIAFIGVSKSAKAIVGILLVKCTSLKPSTSAMTRCTKSCGASTPRANNVLRNCANSSTAGFYTRMIPEVFASIFLKYFPAVIWARRRLTCSVFPKLVFLIAGVYEFPSSATVLRQDLQ